jgi:uncharacterized repeat protein (TIGR01451 family)
VAEAPIDTTKDFAAFADVTDLVVAAGEGEYRVADVQGATGRDAYAGWALVVAFEEASEPLRNLAVFDGYVPFFNSSSTVNVSGFRTPPTGTVNTRLGAVVYEGEGLNAGGGGEALSVEATLVGDALNPTDNFYNGTISALGSHFTAKNPHHLNQLGSIDIDVVALQNVLANGSTDADIGFSAGQFDGMFAHVLTFATEVQQPVVTLDKTVTDLNGGDVRAGDVLEYTITAANVGNDDADDVVVTDAVPVDTTFVPGSIVVAGTAVTDAVDADAGEFAPDVVTARLGSIPTAGTGVVKFRVRVQPGATVGTVVTNVADAAYEIPASTVVLTAQSPPAQAAVAQAAPAPAVTLTKSVVDVDGGTVRAGDLLEYTITAANGGDDTAQSVTVSDALPVQTSYVAGTTSVAGAAVTDAAGDDAGEVVAGTLTARLGDLAAGAQKSVTVRARIGEATPVGTSVANTAAATYRAPVSGSQLGAQSNEAALVVAEPQLLPTIPTPPPPPVVAPPTFAQVVVLPSTRRCVSRRRFRIRLREPQGVKIVDARVFVNGKRVKVVRGSRLRAPVDLRGLPKGRFKVEIRLRTADGKTIKGTRRYRTCTPKRRS